ncbi:MAG: hypothetical protein ACK5WS_04910 [Alphaproteobacteria bacterium]|nr:hypothetical protein [Candidatus Jidaibacter sp.]
MLSEYDIAAKEFEIDQKSAVQNDSIEKLFEMPSIEEVDGLSSIEESSSEDTERKAKETITIPAFQYALHKKQYAIAEFILESAKLKITGYHFEVFKDDLEALKILLKHGMKVDDYLLTTAKDNETLSHLLLEYATTYLDSSARDINAQALSDAINYRKTLADIITATEFDEDALKQFIKYHPGCINWILCKNECPNGYESYSNPLDLATKLNNKAAITILHDVGAKLCEHGYDSVKDQTLAEWSQKFISYSIEEIKKFIQAHPECVNWDIEYQKIYPWETCTMESSPLYYAIDIDSTDLIDLLLENNAKVTAKHLDKALYENKPDTVLKLLKSKNILDINRLCYYTALINHPEINLEFTKLILEKTNCRIFQALRANEHPIDKVAFVNQKYAAQKRWDYVEDMFLQSCGATLVSLTNIILPIALTYIEAHFSAAYLPIAPVELQTATKCLLLVPAIASLAWLACIKNPSQHHKLSAVSVTCASAVYYAFASDNTAVKIASTLAYTTAISYYVRNVEQYDYVMNI